MQRPAKSLILCVVALVVALVPAAALAAGLPKLAVGDSSRFSVRPHFIELSGDGSLFIAGSRTKDKIGTIAWRRWSSSSARGSGYVWVNDCTPDCASGKFHGTKVGISASSVSGGEYRRVTLSCTVGGKSKTDTLTLQQVSKNFYFWRFGKLAC